MTFNDFMQLSTEELKILIKRVKLYDGAIVSESNINAYFEPDIMHSGSCSRRCYYRLPCCLDELYKQLSLNHHKSMTKKRKIRTGFMRIDVNKLINEIDNIRDWRERTKSELSMFEETVREAIREMIAEHEEELKKAEQARRENIDDVESTCMNDKDFGKEVLEDSECEYAPIFSFSRKYLLCSVCGDVKPLFGVNKCEGVNEKN